MMNVGVIGMGKMGMNHARVYSELRGVDNVFAYDPNVNMPVGSVKYCDNLSELLEETEAVSICTPTPAHLEVALRAFDAGVHTLIEKPMCSTIGEGKHLVSSIPKNLIVGVGHIERFNPVVGEMKKIMQNPLYIEIKRHNPVSARSKGTSVIDALMIHDIDIIANAFHCDYSVITSAIGNMDVCSVLMRYGVRGIPIYISASRVAAKKIRTIYVEEEDLTIEGDLMAQELSIYRTPKSQMEKGRYTQENVIEKVLVNKVEPLKVELSTFISCVAARKPFPVSAKEALCNIKVCEDIKRLL